MKEGYSSYILKCHFKNDTFLDDESSITVT